MSALAGFGAARVRAQVRPDATRQGDGPSVAQPDDAGPAESTGTEVVDDAASIEREQREAETEASASSTAGSDRGDAVPADSLSHRLQVGLRVGAGGDAFFAVKYSDGPACGAPGETLCRGLGTGLLDAEVAFGVTHTVEVSALARFGLGADPAAASRPLLLGLGVRAYGSPHGQVKLFMGGRAMLDLTSSDVAGWKNVDLGVRGEFGLQIDFLRFLGAYAQVGATIQFLNALSFAGDATGGLQARFP
jgi:hypothetical protein